MSSNRLTQDIVASVIRQVLVATFRKKITDLLARITDQAIALQAPKSLASDPLASRFTKAQLKSGYVSLLGCIQLKFPPNLNYTPDQGRALRRILETHSASLTISSARPAPERYFPILSLSVDTSRHQIPHLPPNRTILHAPGLGPRIEDLLHILQRALEYQDALRQALVPGQSISQARKDYPELARFLPAPAPKQTGPRPGAPRVKLPPIG